MKAIVFALLAGLCWGVGEFLTKQVLMSGKIGPWAVVMSRIVLAVPLGIIAFIVAAHVLKGEPKQFWTAPPDVLWRLLVGTVVLSGFSAVAFFYLGLKFGDISVVKPMAMGLSPVVGALLGWYFLKEPMPLAKVLGIGMMVGGLVLVGWSGRSAHAAGSPASASTDPAAQPTAR